jgi:xanthine dehydrogenase small subunit
MSIAFTLNGQRTEIDGFDPNTTLLAFLREVGLTGCKEGCAEGECGACAVVLVKKDRAGGARYEPVNACLLLLGAIADQEVLTVEGVARGGALHPVQAALVEKGGSQCGYCTPGFVMSLFAEYYRKDRSFYDAESISGNLCRCTGYRPIREVAQQLGRPADDDPHLQRLGREAPSLGPVAHSARGRHFHRPTSLAEAFEILAEHPDARLVAGGTDLVVEMNQRHARFDTLVSLEAVPELGTHEWRDDRLTLGAGLSLSEIERVVRGRVPMLEQLLPLFASRLIRNRATLGGNLMTASPVGDSPPALLALDAQVELASASGRRVVRLDQFFTGYRKTLARPGELLTAVTIPLPLPELQRFYKVSKRVVDDISTVAAAFSLRFDGEGKVAAARLAYGGVAPTPARATAAEKVMEGRPWNLDTVNQARVVLARAFEPISDHRGSADFRATMVVRLLEKFWFETGGK